MKHSLCKKITSAICSLFLLAAILVPALAEPVITSVPSTNGKYCSHCGVNSMAATGGTRSETKYFNVDSCAEIFKPHVHAVTITYATYMCSICGNWGENIAGKTYSCTAA